MLFKKSFLNFIFFFSLHSRLFFKSYKVELATNLYEEIINRIPFRKFASNL